MTRTVDELVHAWRAGDVDITDADDIDDVDGFTIQATFECKEGQVILTYDLKEEFSYRPEQDSESGQDTMQFNILNDDIDMLEA